MTYFIYYWIDTIWLPIAFFTVHKKHRWLTVGFLISCMIMMRLQAEIMDAIGHPTGLLPIIDSPIQSRNLLIYSFFYILFLIMAVYSPNTERVVFLGACLSIFFAVFTVSGLALIL